MSTPKHSLNDVASPDQDCPAGYWRDTLGRLVPVAKVKEVDQARDTLVREIVAKALALRTMLQDFKLGTFSDVEAFVDLSLERYGARLGGTKGNVQLTTFDGQYVVKRAVQESIAFDEGLQAAKVLVDRCLSRWAENSSDEIRTLITEAFKVDSEGRISTARVLSLRRYRIDDPEWRQAMDAIGDSLHVAASKSYLRIYQRNADGRLDPVSLDIAAV